jgi:hypothetical protein
MCILYRHTLQAQGKEQAQGIAEGCARWIGQGPQLGKIEGGGVLGLKIEIQN